MDTYDEENTPAFLIDLYTVNAVRDLNDDGVAEIIAVHVEERESSRAGHIKLISGKTGKLIRSISTPFREEVFVPIQIITQADGTECLLIITGGQNSAGGVYLLRIHSLMKYSTEVNIHFENAHIFLFYFHRLILESFFETLYLVLWYQLS